MYSAQCRTYTAYNRLAKISQQLYAIRCTLNFSMNKVFVYTGTGNSYASARQLGELLKAEVLHITEELSLSAQIFTGEIGVLVFPVYAYGVPKLVKRFIKNCGFNFDYFASLGTVGTKAGGALYETIKLFKKRGQAVSYTDTIKAVENFVHLFKLPTNERITELCENQAAITKTLADAILEKQTNTRKPFRPASAMISFIFRRAKGLFTRCYKVEPNCNGCGVCYRTCPPKAIEMVEKTFKKDNSVKIIPKFSPKKCDFCQACMQLCPQKAIKYNKVKPSTRRYCHTNVALKELLKRDYCKKCAEDVFNVEDNIENNVE